MKEFIVQFILSSFLILFAMVSSVSTVFSQNLPLQQRLDPKPLTILISIDGFKPLYLDRGVTPTLNELAAQGAKAKGLLPVFPSVTFPNHYSIVTGLYPDHHGIVNNAMWDANIEEPFQLSSHTAMIDPRWWSGGVPLWVSARQQGLHTSTLFWPGSEAKIQGVQANDWLTFNKSMDAPARVVQLTQWLNRPREQRADFATLYFDDVDTAGHRFGPDSAELNQAVAHVDQAIGHLRENLDQLGILPHTTFIIVSDHGMVHVPQANRIPLQAVLRPFSKVTIEWQGAVTGLRLHGESEKEVLAAMQNTPHLTCWPKSQIPNQYHFGSHPRIPEILCLSEIAWTTTNGLTLYHPLGQHGYDPANSEMHGLFIASGFRVSKTKLDYFENIEVYPLIAHLLNIRPEKNDAQDLLFTKIIHP